MSLSLFFFSCEKDSEVIDCGVSINSESITSSYTAASVVCDFYSNSTLENVYIQYAKNNNFANYQEKLMDRIAGKHVVCLSNLEPNTNYYLRYVFRNRYSSISPIKRGCLTTTSSPSVPIVITDSASEVSYTSAAIGGNIISNGGNEITECGIVYNLTSVPTINNIKIPLQDVSNRYTLSINNLADGTMYYVRSYGINNNGISYGQEINFVTKSYSVPSVETITATDIAYTSADVGGKIISTGGLDIKECGVVYSTNVNPTIHDMKEIVYGNTESFLISLTNLTQGKTYYVRAYAINEKGIGYGEQVALTTLEKPNENGYEYVDLGLSVKWATHNIGTTKPEESGDYFAWGEVETKDWFDWHNYKWSGGNEYEMKKYCTDNLYTYNWGIPDYTKKLKKEDDVAYIKWGGGWRIPTAREFKELIKKCNWIWTYQNDMAGYKVSSKKNGNSIFLPVTGYIDESMNWKPAGFYWSSTLYEEMPCHANGLLFDNDELFVDGTYRYRGYTIRPVCP